MRLEQGVAGLFCLLCLVASTSAEGGNPFGFTGHEIDSETGLYYMKGRYYDPQTGRFLTPDPAQGDPRIPSTLHPYLYALNNPLVYIDPDGREVRVVNELALERIKSTLPAELQGAVVAGEGGLLQREALNAVKSDNPNFLALQELVNHTNVTAVTTAPAAEYLDEDGRRQTLPFVYETPEQIRAELVAQGIPEKEAERLVGPEDFTIGLGHFLTPRDHAANSNPNDDRKGRSLTNEATAIVADDSIQGVPEVEHAMTTAHELFGHGLLYQREEPFTHPPVPGSLFDEIQERTKETYNRNMTGVVTESTSGPGAVMVKANESRRQNSPR